MMEGTASYDTISKGLNFKDIFPKALYLILFETLLFEKYSSPFVQNFLNNRMLEIIYLTGFSRA